jgi:SAM-dependent methyltransferase
MEINFKTLFKYAKKPEYYAQSTASLWDDEHISKGMLEAHLDPDWDAASRKHSFIDKSVEWIADFAGPNNGDKVLDLGCGPGLYAERLSKKGYKVTGIDFSRRSINYAKEHALKEGLDISYFYQDYLTMDFEKEFNLIILIFCDFGVLPDEQRDLLLKKIYRALKPGGKLIFDVFTPKHYVGVSDENRAWELRGQAGFWRPAPCICLKTEYIYPEHDTHLEQVIVLDETDNVEIYNLWDHAYTVESIKEVMISSGFEKLEFFSDAAGTGYSELSETLCAAAEKQAAPSA